MNDAVTSIAEEVGSRWKLYPAYKDSGVEWLGEIPEHWTSVRLRHACKHITDGSHYSPPVVSDGLPYVTVRDLKEGVVDVEGASRISRGDFKALERSGCKPTIGDVLFSKDGTIGKVAVVNRDDFVVLSSLAILRPHHEIESRFLGFFLNSVSGKSQIESRFAGAALRRITLDVIVDLEMCIPPLPEQRAIASFLDRETAHLDALISKKERLIELLAEKRAALISHAVTKGLDLTVLMKDSGVEWIGEIPAHWEMKRLKLGSKQVGDGDHQPPQRTIDGIPYITAKNLKSGSISYEGCTFVAPEYKQSKQAVLAKIGDCLISCVGSLGEVAFVRTNDVECFLDRNIIYISPDERYLHRDYLFMSLLADEFQEQVDLWARGTAQGHIYLGQVRNAFVVIPPLLEQNTIVAFLDGETFKIDALISKVRTHIEKLKEYRTALISAAVTGKIDVREGGMNGHLGT